MSSLFLNFHQLGPSGPSWSSSCDVCLSVCLSDIPSQEGGGSAGSKVIFFDAPNLFVCLQEAPKHIRDLSTGKADLSALLK